MTVTFENFGSTERIAYLKQPLTIGSAPTSTDPKIRAILPITFPGETFVFSLKTSDILKI